MMKSEVILSWTLCPYLVSILTIMDHPFNTNILTEEHWFSGVLWLPWKVVHLSFESLSEPVSGRSILREGESAALAWAGQAGGSCKVGLNAHGHPCLV